MTNTERGIVVAFTCWCGAEQTHGSPAARRPAATQQDAWRA